MENQTNAQSTTVSLLTIRHVIQVEAHVDAITPQNALQLVSSYDVVLDCTDNAPTRYLISDACVLAGKPLVSGAAIGTDGQLTVYNHGEDGEQRMCLTVLSTLAVALLCPVMQIICKAPLLCMLQQQQLLIGQVEGLPTAVVGHCSSSVQLVWQ